MKEGIKDGDGKRRAEMTCTEGLTEVGLFVTEAILRHQNEGTGGAPLKEKELVIPESPRGIIFQDLGKLLFQRSGKKPPGVVAI